MCLYPKTIRNRKYTATQKNGGDIPSLPVTGYDHLGEVYDDRVLYIQVPCGRCKECCEKRAHEWQVRLMEEIKDWKHMYFMTLTFSPEGLREILFKHKIEECNAAAAWALRHSLERYRKEHKKSYKHWFITELGHEGTERIHMHGIIFMEEEQEFEVIDRKGDGYMAKWKYWKYGHVFVGDYVNEKSVNYVVKYMNKIDTDHKTFVGQILCSPGIGKRYIDLLQANGHDYDFKYRPRNTRNYYRLNNGSRVNIPTYYKNKLRSEEERELIWREYMDRDTETIAGNIYYAKETDEGTRGRIKDKAKEINKSLDYGDNTKEWKKEKHNITRRMLQDQERRKRIEEMKETLITNYANRPGKVTLEETFEFKKAGLTGKEIDQIVALRGRNF